jgi:hypothetical protein
MEIINNYNDAFEIGKKYITNMEKLSNKNKNKNKIFPPLTKKEKESFEISLTSLKNTLTYIFKYLHHPCYLVCVDNSNSLDEEKKNKIFKLVHNKTSPIYKKILNNELKKVDLNPYLREKQKLFIKNSIKNKEIRIMQCIIKEIDKDDEYNKNKTNEIHEYNIILQDLNLPNGVFIFNLTDALILRKDRLDPFFKTNINLCNRSCKFLPIFSTNTKEEYEDIAIPNYDDVQIVLGLKPELDFNKFITNWQNKIINKAIFRGGSSGCGYTSETNMRLKLLTIESPDLDVGIVGKGKTIDSTSIKIDPIYGLGMLNTSIKSADFVSLAEQSKYKYIIHIDGNVSAYRLLTTMVTGSLILRVKSDYINWYDSLIKPDVDYIEIKSDLSDLLEKIDWCKKNDKKCEEIASHGREFAIKTLTKKVIDEVFEEIIWDTINKKDNTNSDGGKNKRTKNKRKIKRKIKTQKKL